MSLRYLDPFGDGGEDYDPPYSGNDYDSYEDYINKDREKPNDDYEG